MHCPYILNVLTIISLAHCQGINTSSKRGLVYIPSTKHPSDDRFWDSSTSDLTWYYNYASTPSPSFANSNKLQFVPMLFGANDSSSDTAFLDDVQAQIKGGAKIPYILAFNEPDGQGNGGSNVSPDLAAKTWIREIEPLKKQGVKLGAPAVTGATTGFTWLQSFFTACKGKCSADFIPIHWYGNFEGLAGHIGQVRAAYPNMTIWITEYTDNDVPLEETQTFYNSSSQYFDRIDYITHYSYFGSFRSDVSNVGPNAAMLTQDGKLTDIGSWYLGGSATGNKPKNSAAEREVIFTVSRLLMVSICAWNML